MCWVWGREGGEGGGEFLSRVLFYFTVKLGTRDVVNDNCYLRKIQIFLLQLFEMVLSYNPFCNYCVDHFVQNI